MAERIVNDKEDNSNSESEKEKRQLTERSNFEEMEYSDEEAYIDDSTEDNRQLANNHEKKQNSNDNETLKFVE